MNENTPASVSLPVPAEVMAFTREVVAALGCSTTDIRTVTLAQAIMTADDSAADIEAAVTQPGMKRKNPHRIGDSCSCGGKLEYQAAEPEVNWPESYVCDECGFDFLDEAKSSDEDAKEGC